MTNGKPYDQAHDLARAIKDSAIYQRYLEAQKQLSQHSEALEQVLEFRHLQIEFNRTESLGQASPEGRVSELAIQYTQLNEDEVIAEYFEAEGKFVQMYNDIQEIIQKGLDSGFEE